MNPILTKTKEAVLQKADQRLHPVIMKLVGAGQEVMYSEKTRQMMVQQLGNGQDPEAVGAAVAKLVGILFNQSKSTAPMQALIPAATILLLEGLQFLEDAGTIQVTPQSLAQYMQAMASNVLQIFGVTPEKLQGMIKQSGAPAEPAQPEQPPPAAGIVGGATQEGAL